MLTSCHTAQKYVESGDYDSAIDFCVHKLRGKPNKKIEYVQGLEAAFKKAQARDLATVDHLLAGDHPENWARIHEIHIDIRERQHKVAPLLPLVAKNGYRAQIDFVDIATMERKSRENTADYLYDQSVALLEKADKGDKMAARKAYDLLHQTERYYPNFRDKNELLVQARDLGTSYVVFEVNNQSGQNLPREFENRILAIGKQELDSEWKDFSFVAKPGLSYDYKAIFKLHDIDISPERVQERTYVDEKDIEDGWEYVLDKRGNVMKDTLGNDIKRKHMAHIRAEILEVHQSKAARIAGVVEIRDSRNNTLLETHPITTEVLFENYASTFRGDARALRLDSKNRIGNQPVPFPRDEDMLVQAAERINRM